MNDSILFLALATVFGVAMLVVGWALGAEVEARRYDQKVFGAFRDNPNPQDSAGG